MPSAQGANASDKRDPVGFRRRAIEPAGFRSALPHGALAAFFAELAGVKNTITATLRTEIQAKVDIGALSRIFEPLNTRWITTLRPPVFPTIEVPGLAEFQAKVRGQVSIAASVVAQHTQQFRSIQASLLKVDTGALSRIVELSRLAMLPETLNAAISVDWNQRGCRDVFPANWPINFGGNHQTIAEILNVEGVPLTWVPRQEVVLKLISAPTFEAREAILQKHRREILEDCTDIINGLDDDFMAGQIPLAREAIAAFNGGFHAIAGASAALIINSIVEGLNWPTKHHSLRRQHAFTPATKLGNLIERSTRAPFVSFYAEWNPKSGQPAPRGLSRHVVSHRITDAHLHMLNCLKGLMLMASLMKTVNHLQLGHRVMAVA